MKKLFISIAGLAIILSACSGGSASSTSDPIAIMEAYEAAWNAQDLDAVIDRKSVV